MYVPDNYSQWEAHDRRQEQLLNKLPKCDRCRKTIQEHYFYVFGDTYCEACNTALFRMEVTFDE